MQRLGFLGCGHIGKVVLKGILQATKESPVGRPSFLVSVPRAAATLELRNEFAEHKDRVQISTKDNIKVATLADTVLLCFPGGHAESVLREPGIADAVKGKLIVSLLAGVSSEQIRGYLSSQRSTVGRSASQQTPPQIIRVIPTVGAKANEAAILILEEHPPLPPDVLDSVKKLFGHLGKTYNVPERLFEPVAALTAVSHAIMTVAIDALIDGSAAAGIPRKYVEGVATQCLRAHASLVYQGEDNAELKKFILIPGGMTVQSIISLEGGGMRTAISKTVIDVITDRGK